MEPRDCDRYLDGWAIVCVLLMLPAIGLTVLALGLTLISLLDAIQQGNTMLSGLTDFAPDLVVTWAGSVGAWWSVVIAGRNSRM